MTPEQIRTFMVDPPSAAVDESARIKVQPAGPLPTCCADFAYVVFCDGEIDEWCCPVCASQWRAPCR